LNKKIALITIDLESWLASSKDLFQSTKDMENIPIPDSIIHNTRWFLNILNKLDIKATFFILGRVAKNYPSLLKDVLKFQHEIGNHTYSHDLLHNQKRNKIKGEIILNHRLIKEISGVEPKSFRVPYFSFSKANQKIILGYLEELGYTVDSSIFPRGLYLSGTIKSTFNPRNINRILEIPLSVLNFNFLSLSLNIPVSGGGYYRLMPNTIIKFFLKRFLKNNNIITLYFHPYEIDPTDVELVGNIASLPLKEKVLLVQQKIGRKSMKQKIKDTLLFLKNQGFEFMTLQQFYAYWKNGNTQ